MAMMVHTSASAADGSFSVGGTSNGHLVKHVEFIGRAAHAGSLPHRGVNALQAAMVALNALNTQRETLKNEDVVRLHGIVTAGGVAANSVPASVRYEGRVRARSDEALRDASGKMDRCLRAGALALGAKVRIVTVPGYLPIRHDRKMTALFQANAERLVGAGSVIRHPWDRVRGRLDRHGRPQPDHAGHPSLQRRRHEEWATRPTTSSTTTTGPSSSPPRSWP